MKIDDAKIANLLSQLEKELSNNTSCISEQQKIINKILKIIEDHEGRLLVLEKKKPSRPPRWFQDWNDTVFDPRMTKLETKVDNMDKRLCKVESDVSELKTDVNQLKTDVTHLKTDVNQLKTDVNHLKVDVDNLKVNVENLKVNVDALNKKVFGK